MLVKTDLRVARESAAEIRYYPVAPMTATNVQDAIAQAQALPPSITGTVVTFAMSPYTPTNSDFLLLVNTSAGAVTINLQPAAARGGLQLGVKDDTGNAVANPIALVGNGAETTDGIASYPIDSAFGAVTLQPKAGGNYDVV